MPRLMEIGCVFGAVWACIEPSVGVAQSGRDGRLILPAEAYGVCFAPIVQSDGALLPFYPTVPWAKRPGQASPNLQR
ncbi:MAG: hypothetical protein RIR04_2028 [Pseudomonadota bacterium]|jgi:hypothetical protein